MAKAPHLHNCGDPECCWSPDQPEGTDDDTDTYLPSEEPDWALEGLDIFEPQWRELRIIDGKWQLSHPYGPKTRTAWLEAKERWELRGFMDWERVHEPKRKEDPITLDVICAFYDDAWQVLAPDELEVHYRHHINGQTVEATAKAMGKSVATIKRLVGKIRARVPDELV